ncbi:hypothetical protein ACROYT_G028720 [Oculina patagonica]
MEDSASSNAQDAVNNKSNEAKKERPKSLDLESSNFGNEEELDDTKATTRKAKDFSSSQEDLLESPDDGDESGQRTSPRSKSITNSFKSKIRDLSPSRRSTPPGSASKPERKTSKGNKPASKTQL